MPGRSRFAAVVIITLMFTFTVPVYGQKPEQEPPKTEDSPSFQQYQTHTLSLAELRRKYAETFKFKGPHARVKEVALTFDDVPDPRFTPQVLAVLRAKNVKATFFVVGDRAKKHPGLVKAIRDQGHAIGNHSYDHPLLKKQNMSQFKQQILRTEQVVFHITGKKPLLIRPPYGEINEQQVRWAGRNGYKIVNWNVDSLDWTGIGRINVQRNILTHVVPGSIVLQHAGGGVGSDLSGTIEALPFIIDELRARGYQFVTLPKMLHIPESKS